jgi:hypothetical protein
MALFCGSDNRATLVYRPMIAIDWINEIAKNNDRRPASFDFINISAWF